MKLRIQDNSIRLRLTRPEVDRLNEGGEVAAAAAFPGRRALRYAVRGIREPRRVGARYEGDAILVTIPVETIRTWAGSDGEVSIEGSEPLPDGDSLAILVEKDFACLAPREGEDDADMFPHPRRGEASC